VVPAVAQVPVLVIDDNADTLQLLQRYTMGTRFRFMGSRDPEQALERAAEASPSVIVLDVMMPEIDGWKVLGRLREHPVTGGVPIVVCTILAQKELALSLGASGFIRKPMTRQEFLGCLDAALARRERAPG
jgi:CheY-like chemotaxis protein